MATLCTPFPQGLHLQQQMCRPPLPSGIYDLWSSGWEGSRDDGFLSGILFPRSLASPWPRSEPEQVQPSDRRSPEATLQPRGEYAGLLCLLNSSGSEAGPGVPAVTPSRSGNSPRCGVRSDILFWVGGSQAQDGGGEAGTTFQSKVQNSQPVPQGFSQTGPSSPNLWLGSHPLGHVRVRIVYESESPARPTRN